MYYFRTARYYWYFLFFVHFSHKLFTHLGCQHEYLCTLGVSFKITPVNTSTKAFFIDLYIKYIWYYFDQLHILKFILNNNLIWQQLIKMHFTSWSLTNILFLACTAPLQVVCNITTVKYCHPRGIARYFCGEVLWSKWAIFVVIFGKGGPLRGSFAPSGEPNRCKFALFWSKKRSSAERWTNFVPVGSSSQPPEPPGYANASNITKRKCTSEMVLERGDCTFYNGHPMCTQW